MAVVVSEELRLESEYWMAVVVPEELRVEAECWMAVVMAEELRVESECWMAESDMVDTMEADNEDGVDMLGNKMVGKKVGKVAIAEVQLARTEMKAVGSIDSLVKDTHQDTMDTLWTVGKRVASEPEVVHLV